MSYFKNVKVKDVVFGLVFGKGIVRSVWDDDSFYKFEVEYDNGYIVPYTIDGIPGWSLGKLNEQTVFYEKDIDLFNIDFSPIEKVLKPKQIIKLRNKKELEMRCPSGIWVPIDKCPLDLVEENLEKGNFHLFRRIEI